MKNPFSNPRILYCIVIVLLLSSCYTKENKPDPKAKKDLAKDTPKAPVFVSEMYYFPVTDEFYTPLFFHPDFDERESGSLNKFLDSTVYARNNIKRRRMPMEVAKRTFMLMRMDSLFIYDTNHLFISKAALVRVEYFEDEVDNKFIAVYSGGTMKTDPAERYYCTNDLLQHYRTHGFYSSVVNDQSLNKFIIHQLRADPDIAWNIRNIQVFPGHTTYSIVNSYDGSFVTELNSGNQFNIVLNMNSGYRVENILPLPFEINKRPLMLIRVYNEEETSGKTFLAAFADYQEYKLMRHNSLKLK